MSDFQKTKDLYSKYVMPTHAPDMLLSRGQGAWLWDDQGRKYLDFGSGIGVCSLGHCHPAVTKAVSEQAAKLVHVSNLYMNENQPRLAEKLVTHGFPDGLAFFSNSGAEANEGMIKLARKYGNPKGRFEIIAMEDSFHGRTLATLAATGRDKYRKGFSPDMPGFKFVPFNDLAAAEKAVDEKTAAILLEPVQGEGGVIPADPAYLKGLRKLCDDKDIMLLFDEVQCGMGRTGHLYAHQGYGVSPDAFSLAKALGNGFPIGAFLAKRKFGEALTAGTHASTFGGTPLACAAAIAVIDAFDEENILQNCREMGAYLLEKLAALKGKCDVVKDVRGRGLMVGVVLDRPAAKLLPLLREEGVLALSAGETVLRLLPPLVVKKEEIDLAVAAIGRALAKLPKD